MFKVYWCESGEPKSKDFTSPEMSLALQHCEALRLRGRAGEAVSFVTMASENPDSVTKPGVDVTGPDYDWKKRRI